MAGTAGAHFRSVGIKYAGIVCLSVFCKKFYNLRIYFKAIVLAGLYRHADASVRLEGTLKWLIRLESYDGLFIFIQVTGAVGGNGRNDLSIHIQYAAGLAFLL